MMKPAEICKRIAELTGWKEVEISIPQIECVTGCLGGKAEVVPDYTSDLNACHEMERVLIGDDRADYLRKLSAYAYVEYDCDPVFAPAKARCVAFLRVMGKVDPDPGPENACCDDSCKCESGGGCS